MALVPSPGSPFSNDPLDNPVRRKAVPFVNQAVNLLVTTLAVTTTLVARDPLYSQTPKARSVQHQQQTNLLTSTLAQVGAVTAPFVNEPIENLPRRAAAQQIAQHVNRLPITTPPDYYFLNDTGLSVNVIRAQRPQDLANLLLTTLAPVVQAPFVVQQVVQPRARTKAQDVSQQNLLTTTLAVTVQAPFAQRDWPNPVRSKAVVRVEYQNVTLQLPVAPLPLNNYQWPNPTRLKVGIQNILAANISALLALPPPPIPFNQYHWPNPQPIKPVPERWSTSQGLNPELITTTPEPPETTPRRRGRIVFPKVTRESIVSKTSRTTLKSRNRRSIH